MSLIVDDNAHTIFNVLWSDLKDRSGCDLDIDKETLAEIRKAWVKEIRTYFIMVIDKERIQDARF